MMGAPANRHDRGRTLLLRLGCILAASTTGSDGYRNSPDRPMFDSDGALRRRAAESERAGRRRPSVVLWPSSPGVPLEREVGLLRSGALVRRGEFGPLRGSRALEVELECAELGLSFHQASSIRKQLMMHKLLKGARKLKDESVVRDISRKFECRQRSLLEISQEYDLPPVSIFRAILAERLPRADPRFGGAGGGRRAVDRAVRSIIRGGDPDVGGPPLSEWELTELRTAREHDIVGHRSANCTAAADWERAVYDYLDEREIGYVAESALKMRDRGTGTGTPDCLPTGDLRVNGRPVRWIEFKCFYASGLRENSFTRRALSRQVERYEAEFGGGGAVILKNGFCDRISRRHPSTLFLDGGNLYPGDEYDF